MTKNVPLSEEGLELLVDCLLLAKSCYEERIGQCVLSDAYIPDDMRRKIQRYRTKVAEIDNLINHLTQRLPKREARPDV
jgi:hypothetical protein